MNSLGEGFGQSGRHIVKEGWIIVEVGQDYPVHLLAFSGKIYVDERDNFVIGCRLRNVLEIIQDLLRTFTRWLFSLFSWIECR